MRRTPFDDPRAFRRRWAHLTPEQLRAEATRDPLLFAADHVSIFDRHEGSVVVLADLDGDLPPSMIVIPGGPPDPTEEDCLGLLAGVVSRTVVSASSSDATASTRASTTRWPCPWARSPSYVDSAS